MIFTPLLLHSWNEANVRHPNISENIERSQGRVQTHNVTSSGVWTQIKAHRQRNTTNITVPGAATHLCASPCWQKSDRQLRFRVCVCEKQEIMDEKTQNSENNQSNERMIVHQPIRREDDDPLTNQARGWLSTDQSGERMTGWSTGLVFSAGVGFVWCMEEWCMNSRGVCDVPPSGFTALGRHAWCWCIRSQDASRSERSPHHQPWRIHELYLRKRDERGADENRWCSSHKI